MNRKIKAAIALILAIATVAAVFTGCTNKKRTPKAPKESIAYTTDEKEPSSTLKHSVKLNKGEKTNESFKVSQYLRFDVENFENLIDDPGFSGYYDVLTEKSSRSVILKPVKFNASAYTQTCKVNRRRFDNFVIINKIVTFCYFIYSLDSAFYFRLSALLGMLE